MWTLLSLLACRSLTLVEPAPPAPRLQEWQAAVDWDAAGDEAVQLLSDYLRVDTVNPPGNETRGAEFLASYLSAEGIDWDIYEFAPGRGSLVAKLPGSGEAGRTRPGPLCLLSHIDVVPSETELWPEGRGPLSGTIDEEGMIWGRGALDMKGMGAIELMTMLLLHRQGVPLKRDVILLAVADEEIDGLGIRHLIDRHWADIGCEYVVNEGGIGVEDMLFEGQTVYPISVGEKGFAWMRVYLTGEPGHGSVPLPHYAPTRLREALKALDAYEPEPNIHESILELAARAGAHQGGIEAAVLTRPGLARRVLQRRLMADPLTRAGITDTLHVTGYGGANAPNVVPSEVWFQIDSRVLPGTTPEEMVAEVEALLADIEGVRVELTGSWGASVTEWRGDPFYDALARNIAEEGDHIVAGPAVSVGFTDSLYLRPLGVKAFGFVPFAAPPEELVTMHGSGERVSSEEVRRGLRVLYEAVVEVAADPEGELEAPIWGRLSDGARLAPSATSTPTAPPSDEPSPWTTGAEEPPPIQQPDVDPWIH
jgi:acetylornithine deacetylase/succinyl-diaminopimelate desuccinylase-like protein